MSASKIIKEHKTNILEILICGYTNEISKKTPNAIRKIIIKYCKTAVTIIDNGSGTIKAGFGALENNDKPPIEFPSIVGRLRHKGITGGICYRKNYVGNVAKQFLGNSMLRFKYPIEHGIVTNWDDMEKIWHYTYYNKLKIDPEQHKVLLTEAPLNPEVNREKMTQIMFETFNVPALYIAVQSVLSLYAIGKTNGVVVDSGDAVSHIVPVIDGHPLRNAIMRVDIGGRDMTMFLMRIMCERGYSFTTSRERDIVKDIKERLCYISLDYYDDLNQYNTLDHVKDIEKNYELPDGQVITIGTERFRCPEVLFKPSLIGLSQSGIHQVLYWSIMKCNVNERNIMYKNILLCGGNTMFDGMKERIKKEIVALAPTSTEINVIAPENRQYLAWKGGSILSALSSLDQMWMTKSEYDEYGPVLVHRKC